MRADRGLEGAGLPTASADSVLRLIRWLGSPKWMLAFFVFAFIGAQVAIHQPEWITAAWAIPLGIFAVSLLAALVGNPRFRLDAPLLLLHLGLLALVLLLAVARLTYLDGNVTLTQETAFEGKLLHDSRGPWHPDRLAQFTFTNHGVEEVYFRGASRPTTFNRVSWQLPGGSLQTSVITDNQPLTLMGYRIFQTHNRGFSPVFHWQPQGGTEEIGTIQLGAGDSLSAANQWQRADGSEVLWFMLDQPDKARLQPGQQRVNLGIAEMSHQLVLRLGDRRETLRPGESVELPGGRLTYVELRTWMGYRVVYDLAVYWLAAAIAVALAGMIWFYARQLRNSATAAEDSP
jgi:cytochrome c biogenesis protein